MTFPTKTALKAELIEILAANLNTLERANQAAQEGATHEEAKPENDKDTRAIEQSYLARGQAARVEEMRSSLANVRALPVRAFASDQPIALSAVIEVEYDNEPRMFFLAPSGGGTVLAQASVQVVTPSSPLGHALLGKFEGDESDVALGGKTRALVIKRVM